MIPTPYLRFVEKIISETRPFGAAAGSGIIKQERGKILQQWWSNDPSGQAFDPVSKNGAWYDVPIEQEDV